MSNLTLPPQLFDGIEVESPRVRRTDPITSHEAADSNDVAGSQWEVLHTLACLGPLADHELVDWLISEGSLFSPSRIRSARSELTERGHIEFTGDFTVTPRKRRAQIWTVTTNGHDAHSEGMHRHG